jgi:hypothetical protein
MCANALGALPKEELAPVKLAFFEGLSRGCGLPVLLADNGLSALRPSGRKFPLKH